MHVFAGSSVSAVIYVADRRISISGVASSCLAPETSPSPAGKSFTIRVREPGFSTMARDDAGTVLGINNTDATEPASYASSFVASGMTYRRVKVSRGFGKSMKKASAVTATFS